LNGRIKLMALAGVLFIPTTDAMATQEEGMFCTVNSSMQCVFDNGNYYSPCNSHDVQDGDRLISLVAATVCGTFHEGS